MADQQKEFNVISKAVMKTYHEKMHSYLSDQPAGTLTDSDVIMMIMNLTIGVATNIYYSLKQILPTTEIDYDFIRAKISNALIDSFDKIKEFNPKDRNIPLTIEQVEEIRDKGFVIVKFPDGTEKKITEEDVLVTRETADKLIDEAKKAQDTPKLIIPSNKVVSR